MHRPTLIPAVSGHVDLVPLIFGMTPSRSTLVEFSYPIGVLEIVILSRKKSGGQVSGDFLTTIFDLPTMVMLGVSLVATAAAFAFVTSWGCTRQTNSTKW